MITLTVVFCMLLNPTMCRELEMVPIDHAITSPMECIMGGAIGGMQYEQMQFKLEGITWRVRGWRCKQAPSAYKEWAEERKR